MRKSSLPCAECARSVLVMHIFVWCLERCPICWVVVVVDPVEATIKSENGCICIYATVDEEPFQIFKTASRTISTLRKLMLTKIYPSFLTQTTSDADPSSQLAVVSDSSSWLIGETPGVLYVLRKAPQNFFAMKASTAPRIRYWIPTICILYVLVL